MLTFINNKTQLLLESIYYIVLRYTVGCIFVVWPWEETEEFNPQYRDFMVR